MKKYIDADRLMAILENRCDEADNVEAWLAYVRACEDVRDLPAADVLEVVRCKECKYNDLAGKESANALCSRFYGSWQADDYCSYGERKDG